jgi:hypothetical protein
MQEELFHEDINAALGHVIAALGGPKKVGSELWPTMAPDAAARRVADCLNTDRTQQFHPLDLIWILRSARQHGVHSGMAFITRECGYADPQPIEPEDEAAELQRQFIAAKEDLAKMLKRMERLNLPQVRGVA